MDSLFGFILFGAASTAMNYIPWSFFFLFTRYIGIYIYVLHKKEDCQRIQKKLTCSHMTDNGKTYGYAIGRWYIASLFIQDGNGYSDSYTLTILGTQASYQTLIGEREVIQDRYINITTEDTDKTERVAYNELYRSGSYFNIYYRKLPVYTHTDPIGEQKAVMDEIVQAYNTRKNKSLVVLLHGPVGTGKSMIPILISEQLNGSYCNTAKFWEPGDKMHSLYIESDVTEETPLILCFEEVDVIIQAIHKGIERHKSETTQIQCLSDWNSFFDKVQRGVYRNIIIIMTTNKTPDEICLATHPSYLREGRVDMIREMKVPAILSQRTQASTEVLSK